MTITITPEHIATIREQAEANEATARGGSITHVASATLLALLDLAECGLAAPKLVEACKTLLDHATLFNRDSDPVWVTVRDMAQNAIAETKEPSA